MKHVSLVLLILISSVAVFSSPVIRLKKGLVITSSVTVSRETYHIDADTSLQIPLILVEGKNITLDFNNCILQGSNDKKNPNEFYGLAVLVKKGSSGIIIKNANIHAFKMAIMADSVQNLQVENCNLSYNYRQHLHSNWKREDVSDWMSYHHNEHDEWMRYGAGIYLKDCDHARIKDNIITGGQCGLMMMRCNDNDIYNNDFSFNSGIGIGLYRSSDNKIYSNQLDFNVRGYSDGIYNRGQDSAGILVFEQCNNNVFAYNSVTHCGDGFFLWAGQHTMDTGEGGCNDNWIYRNDFSYAPTNGVEVTFSRNDIDYNIIKNCDNGIWGGYSFDTKIFGNKIDSNRIGIAIEHGQHNRIMKNLFRENVTAIKFWSREKQPADWRYAQVKDTRSLSNYIYSNEFLNNKIACDIMGSDSTFLKFNSKTGNQVNYHLGDRVENLDTIEENMSVDIDYVIPYRVTGIKNDKLKTDSNYGRNQIRITEWGPYDFSYPLLWVKNIDSIGLYHFEVLTPKRNARPITGGPGKWKIKNLRGFHVVQNSDNQLTAKADPSAEDRSVQLEYTGAAFTDIFGSRHAANEPYFFGWHEFDPHLKWNINFYKWDSIHDPQKNYAAFIRSLTTPGYSTTAPKIDYTWWGAVATNLPADSFATVATASFTSDGGNYSIGITADDLVKVFIDKKEVIDAWNTSYVQLDENTNHETVVHLPKGNHQIEIVHAEIGGLATLMFYMKRANQ